LPRRLRTELRTKEFRYVTEVFPQAVTRDRRWRERLTIQNMERKIFWISFTVLGLAADFVLPLWWALGATIPIAYASWWVAYRSGWFE
jgi:hypothetical protein